jgi:outer membrane protein TolC
MTRFLTGAFIFGCLITFTAHDFPAIGGETAVEAGSLISQLQRDRRLPVGTHSGTEMVPSAEIALPTEIVSPAEAISMFETASEIETASATEAASAMEAASAAEMEKGIPIDLITCLAEALSRSSSIEDVTSRVAESKARLHSSKINRRIEPTLSATWNESGGNTLTGLALALKYNLDHDGLFTDAVDESRLELLRLSLAEGTVRNDLVDRVVGLYIEALISRASLRVARESTISAYSFLERMRRNFALEVVTPLELWQARAFHANEEYREFLADSRYRRALGSLNVLTGHEYGRSLELAEIPDPVMDETDVSILVDRAFSNRADLKSANLILRMNRLRLDRAKKGLSFRHSMNTSLSDRELTTALEEKRWSFGLGSSLDTGWGRISTDISRNGGENGIAESNSATLSMALNTGYESVVSLESAKGALRRQELSIRDLQDRVVESINSIHVELASSRARIKALDIGLKAKLEEKRKKQKEYDLGLERAEELLDVSAEVIAAETELIVEKYRLLRNTYQLIRELYAFDRRWSEAGSPER